MMEMMIVSEMASWLVIVIIITVLRIDVLLVKRGKTP